MCKRVSNREVEEVVRKVASERKDQAIRREGAVEEESNRKKGGRSRVGREKREDNEKTRIKVKRKKERE